MEELKKCPFCGGEADVCVTPWDYENNKPANNHKYVVECKDCLAETDSYTTREEAIEAWERRVE